MAQVTEEPHEHSFSAVEGLSVESHIGTNGGKFLPSSSYCLCLWHELCALGHFTLCMSPIFSSVGF